MDNLSDNAKKIIDEVSKMSVLELSQLVKAMEEKFGVSAAAPVAVAGAAAVAAPAEEAKDSWDVVLADAGAKKIDVIKKVKELTGLALGEAKAIVDGAPKTVKEGVKTEDAQKMKKELEGVGAKVELK
ncbi:MAG: 50S ribosomal protein L7/L12 [bacterium]